jgi:excinuclease ABC subunit A
VITGLSGSGKSSLAFDTLYAEGQRRYVESLSAYARQFLQLMEKPDVDLIEGLSPAISIEQKATSHNPRSTVGTVTEIHDYLRLLFARAGTPYCPEHNQPLEAQTVSQMVDHVLALPAETKLMILAPVVANRKGEQLDLFAELRAQGFARVRVDGTVYTKSTPCPSWPRRRSTPSMSSSTASRCATTCASAWPNPSRPRCATPTAAPSPRDGFRQRNTCSRPSSPARSAPIRCRNSNRASSRSTTRWAPARSATASASSSSSTPSGRRPSRAVAGRRRDRGWDKRNQFYFQMLDVAGRALRLRRSTRRSSEAARKCPPDRALRLGREAINFRYLNERGTRFDRSHTFEGIIPNLERRYKETDSVAVREELAKYDQQPDLPEPAHGTRLRVEARHVRVGDTRPCTKSAACRSARRATTSCLR